jgi:hypothetical protein
MDLWIELKFFGELLFDHIDDWEKFQIIWIILASTSFTKLLSEYKLWKFAEEYLLGK